MTADVRSISERRASEFYKCQQCGGPHLVDTSLPSVIWNQIAEPSDFLCTWCIDERLQAAGLSCNEAEFYFVGEALSSKLYAESHGDVAKLERELAEARAECERLRAALRMCASSHHYMAQKSHRGAWETCSIESCSRAAVDRGGCVSLNDSQLVIAKSMSERDLSQNVIERARLFGWKVARWPTWRPTGTDPGVPDLLLAKEGREPICAELKSETGKLSPDQSAWMHALHPHVLWKCWRPSDWISGAIDEVLRD